MKKSSVSSLKNEENLIQEANSNYFDCNALIEWLLILWWVKSLPLECVKKSTLRIFLEDSWINKTTLIYVGFIDCLPQQAETWLGKIEYTVTSEIEKAFGSGNKRNAYKRNAFQEHYKIGNYAAEHGNSESANFCALCAYVSTWHACLCAMSTYVVTCQRALLAQELTCQCALHAYVIKR